MNGNGISSEHEATEMIENNNGNNTNEFEDNTTKLETQFDGDKA